MMAMSIVRSRPTLDYRANSDSQTVQTENHLNFVV